MTAAFSKMLKFIRGKGQQPTAERQKLQKDLFAFRKVPRLQAMFHLFELSVLCAQGRTFSRGTCRVTDVPPLPLQNQKKLPFNSYQPVGPNFIPTLYRRGLIYVHWFWRRVFPDIVFLLFFCLYILNKVLKCDICGVNVQYLHWSALFVLFCLFHFQI